MTAPGESTPNSPLQIDLEAIRAACPDHGEHYASIVEANQRMTALYATETNEVDIERRMAEFGPIGERVLGMVYATDELTDDMGGRFFTRLRTIIAGSRTSEVNPIANDLSDSFLASLGRRPDSIDIQNAMMFSCVAIAMINSTITKPHAEDIESDIVNQFSNMLLAKMDPTLLCHAYTGANARGDAEQLSINIAAQFVQATGNKASVLFVASKIMALWINVANAVTSNNMRKAIGEVAQDDAVTQEQRRINTDFATSIQRLRAYGIKPIIFPFGDVVPGSDAVYHEFADFDDVGSGEQPLAVIRLVSQDSPMADKVRIDIRKVPGVLDRLRQYVLGDSDRVIITIDRRGDLHAGLGDRKNALPLQVLFERNGDAAKYEMLRSALLSRLFDAVAPARIVERMGDYGPRGIPEGPQFASTSPIQRLLLPRLRYLTSMKLGELRRAFDAALADERRENERQAFYTGVAPFLRNLPAGAQAGDDARRYAKEAFGDNFELPPGKTFIRGHERTSHRAGEVAGYLAVYRTVGDRPDKRRRPFTD